MPEHAYDRLIAAARRRRPRLALVLGSGLSGIADRLDSAFAVPFRNVPGLTPTTVPGHEGSLILGDWAGVPVLVFAGRVHRYEGVPWRTVTQPIHAAHDLGAETMIFTNAAGGIRSDLLPGTLMALSGHLDCTQPNWWRGHSTPTSRPYDSGLREYLHAAARDLSLELHDGAYAQMTGPCYETRAEIRALRACRADAVGMSTAREVQVAHDLGMRCLGISCITNRAAGLSAGPIHHAEVLEVTARMCADLTRLLESFVTLVRD
jgi:purine-nucleoside phosphorylase